MPVWYHPPPVAVQSTVPASPGEPTLPLVLYQHAPICVDPSPDAHLPQALPDGLPSEDGLPQVPSGVPGGGFFSNTGFFDIPPDAVPCGPVLPLPGCAFPPPMTSMGYPPPGLYPRPASQFSPLHVHTSPALSAPAVRFNHFLGVAGAPVVGTRAHVGDFCLDPSCTYCDERYSDLCRSNSAPQRHRSRQEQFEVTGGLGNMSVRVSSHCCQCGHKTQVTTNSGEPSAVCEPNTICSQCKLAASPTKPHKYGRKEESKGFRKKVRFEEELKADIRREIEAEEKARAAQALAAAQTDEYDVRWKEADTSRAEWEARERSRIETEVAHQKDIDRQEQEEAERDRMRKLIREEESKRRKQEETKRKAELAEQERQQAEINRVNAEKERLQQEIRRMIEEEDSKRRQHEEATKAAEQSERERVHQERLLWEAAERERIRKVIEEEEQSRRQKEESDRLEEAERVRKVMEAEEQEKRQKEEARLFLEKAMQEKEAACKKQQEEEERAKIKKLLMDEIEAEEALKKSEEALSLKNAQEEEESRRQEAEQRYREELRAQIKADLLREQEEARKEEAAAYHAQHQHARMQAENQARAYYQALNERHQLQEHQSPPAEPTEEEQAARAIRAEVQREFSRRDRRRSLIDDDELMNRLSKEDRPPPTPPHRHSVSFQWGRECRGSCGRERCEWCNRNMV